AGTHGLDQDHVETEAFQQADHRLQMFGHGAMSGRSSQTADEDALIVGPARHAEAVAEQRSAGERTLRVTGEDRHAQLLNSEMLDQLADQRALADAARAGDGDDSTRLHGRTELRQDWLGRLAARDQAE